MSVLERNPCSHPRLREEGCRRCRDGIRADLEQDRRRPARSRPCIDCTEHRPRPCCPDRHLRLPLAADNGQE